MKIPVLATRALPVPRCERCPSLPLCVLSRCKADELATLAAVRQSYFYAKGQIIYNEGAAFTGLYCVEQGKIKVTRESGGAREQIVRLGRFGDLLGACSLFGEPVYRTSAAALDDCRVCFLPRQAVVALLQSNPQFTAALLEWMALALQHSDERLMQQATKPVRERLADALLQLQQTYQQPTEPIFAMSISREDLAALVGTAKETVSKLMAEFKEEGLVSTKGSLITILQEQKLRRIATLYN